MKKPAPLRKGDRVAIVSPASKIAPELIDGAVAALRNEGFKPVVMPHAKGVCGSFSGTAQERLADLQSALDDDRIRAILCSRGGYGAVHLLEELNQLPKEKFDKWLIGFSDITVLHALWHKKGVASMHGAMAKYIGRGADGFDCYTHELDMLCGERPMLTFGSHEFNHRGFVRGEIVGGNMAVLGGLIGSEFDPIEPGDILFIEDIAEHIYKVERMLWKLRLRGVFEKIGGVIVGQFTEYKPSADYQTMEMMIDSFFRDYTFPLAYNAPVGHVEANHPLLLGAEATLPVAPSMVTIAYN